MTHRAPLTDAQRRLAETGLVAARRAIHLRAVSAAALCGLSLEDVFQEAYLACCAAARTFQGPGNFETYAATAAINRVRHLLRAAGETCRGVRPVHMDHREWRDVSRDRRLKGDDAGGMIRRLHRRLGRAVSNLTGQQRQALCLYLTGLTNTEIGRELNVNESTVRVYLRRAKARLHAMLSGSK